MDRKKMDQDLLSLAETRCLCDRNSTFFETETGLLMVRITDPPFEGRAFPSLAFPFEEKEAYVCIQNEEKEELGMVRSLSDLPEDAASLLKRELEKKYFAPKILKIKKLTERFGMTFWECDTDKGPLSFTVKDTHRSFIRAGEDRIFVVDHDGCRYEIESISGMDRKSHSKIELYL